MPITFKAPISPRDADRIAAAVHAVNREGHLLDTRQWSQWLDLYEDNAVFWVPAWLDEDEHTADPDTQLSIIYHQSKRELSERVARITSGKSVTSMPLPRTTHFLGNVIATDHGSQVELTANWSVMIYHPRNARQTTLFGRYHYELNVAETSQAEYRVAIAKKVTVLVSDRVPTLLDFYCL